MRRTALASLLALLAIAVAPAAKANDCLAAIAIAESSAGIPAGLLGAIARVESGRPDPASRAVLPWPWTIDVGGAGHFFATEAAAIAAAEALQAQGIAVIDVGCLQVDLAYHPTAFSSLAEAFDPLANALYAARFLRTLFAQTGSWTAAAAAYHSQTQALGAAYREKVLAVWTAPGPASRSAAGPPRSGFAVPPWFGSAHRGSPGLRARLDATPPPAGRSVAAAAALIARLIDAAARCSGKAPGICLHSPFATPAAVRRSLAPP
jgi:Transglycosylase SLT domain